MDFCLRCNAWHDGLGCPINAEIARLRAELDAAKAERDSARAALDKEREACDDMRRRLDVPLDGRFSFLKDALMAQAWMDAHDARRAAEAKEPPR